MTRRRLLGVALLLYPSWWRRHYGAEAVVILEQSPPGARAALDLLRGAVDAWTRQRPPDRLFGRCGDEARQVIVFAQKEAHALNHNYVGTEHILLGLLAAPESVAGRALTAVGVSAEHVRARLNQILEHPGIPPSVGRCSRKRSAPDLPKWSMRITPRVKEGLALSCRAADRLGDADVDPAHLLLGLLDEGEGVGAKILGELVEPEHVRRELTRLRAR